MNLLCGMKNIDVHLQVFRWQMCSDPHADSHRFMEVIETAISAKTVKRYAAFTAWAELTAAKPRPKAKARKAKKIKDDTALVAQIGCALVAHAVCHEASRVTHDLPVDSSMITCTMLCTSLRCRNRAAGQMDGLLASLTAKYSGKAVSSTAEEPSEKEFEAAAARVAKRAKRQ